jgi:lysophospholipase L1-like esterase
LAWVIQSIKTARSSILRRSAQLNNFDVHAQRNGNLFPPLHTLGESSRTARIRETVARLGLRPSAGLAVGFVLLLGTLVNSCDRHMASHSMKYLALGDSYTIGESVPADARWPVQLAARLRDEGIDIADPQIIAKTGWTTSELSAGIDAAKPQGPFALVTLLIGVNDQYRGRSCDAFRKEFEQMTIRAVALADQRNDRVIIVSIPDWGVTPFAAEREPARIAAEIDAYNAICREIAAARNIAFVDITPMSRHAATQPSMIAEDDLHPSAAMYRQWIELILPVARRALQPSSTAPAP